MFDILKKVLKPIGPSGLEEPVAAAIRVEVKDYVDTMETDALGNLICVKKGTDPNGKKIMFSAHMDHIGFIVTGYEKEGFLRVTNVGGIGIDVSLTRHVVFANGVEGVVVCEPVQGAKAMKNLFVDIGAESKEEAEKKVQLGDVAVYAPDCFRLGENRVASPAMDDRCACALLVKLLQTVGETKDTVIAVFSVQEEVGCRGAKVASFAMEPDVGIALDVTAWGDTPEVKLPAIKLGEGCAVKVMDRASISNPALREELLACGEAAGVKTQREVLPFGGTDAGAMQTSRGGIPVCTISIPCRYVHSACETIDMRDMDAALKLLTAYLKK
ncbi:MAG: M20/M25/M40 family metallo-hydrolase [Clostridia bacterium]|nr:M20/M25/M40 family metallo-hydrolase [Clostridia bacterium]MBQ7305228.1 M20/M25/M40 family metallo-hydrolase [Clostridia bacterium]MBQ7865612.1 M20/M25/M40 family metallo-hydrolase [Clostridia bacterium]